MIRFRQRGGFDNTERFLKKSKDKNHRPILEKYAREGVEILRQNTPKDSGETAQSWGFEISIKNTGFSIHWTNTHIVDSVPVVILLHYGHGTRSGTFVEGRDFINPAMKPLFDKISENIWKEVADL